MPYTYFEMEMVNSILKMITANCYVAKLDMKDAYYSPPIFKEHHQYLTFLFRGKLY